MSERISHPSTPKTTVPPWSATQAAADTSATWSAEAGFSIFSLCLEAGLRPPAGRQLLLLAVASRWRCCHHHDGGVWLLIDARASGSSWCCPKNYVTRVRSSYAGKSHKLAKNVEPRVTKASKITQHTVPKLAIFRRDYVPILERSRNFGHLS